MSKTTVVFYHIINDKEDKNSQNVFYICKPINLITLNDIKNEFPLVGTYHFRFKIIHNNTPVWVDINDGSSPIPSLNSCIYAKVLRLSWLDDKKTLKKLPEKKTIEQDVSKLYSNEKINLLVKSKTNESCDINKTKNNIDMLLFETSPTKSTNVNVNKKKDDVKDQNYFDLMFN
ncbi:conserved protein, unknown function [Hepatocystis sp. ex Piliocolobus tephrosceles]|nr:conserved protein, unknown function [Hepatocystis sp. ex Piliocolobus tephrosceles]